MTRKQFNGTLTFTASNMNGRASAKLEVSVHARPSPPEGMLEARNVTKTSCRLQWEACKSDGGLPTEYVAEKYLCGSADGGGWSKIASTTNCHAEVTDLEPMREYDFRVRAVNAVGESDCLQIARTVVAKDKFSKWSGSRDEFLSTSTSYGF